MSLTTAACAERVGMVLRQHYGDVRCIDKRMARRHGWTVRAWRNWWNGTNAPRMAELVVLMAECEALEADVLRMVAAARQKP